MAASIAEAGRLEETLQAGNWDLFEALARVADERQAAAAIRRRVADALAADEYVVRFIPGTARGAVGSSQAPLTAASSTTTVETGTSTSRWSEGARPGSQQGEGLVRIAAEEVGRDARRPDGGLDHREEPPS